MISGVDIVTITWPVWLLVVVLLAVFFIGMFGGNFSSRVEAEKKLEEARSRAEAALQQARQDSERAAARVAQAEKMAAERPTPAAPQVGKTLLRLWLDSSENPQLDLDSQRVEVSPLAEWHRKRLLTLLNVMRPWIEGKPAVSEPQPESPATVTQTPQPASKSIFSSLPRPSLLPGKKEEPVVAPPSIVDQINDILQARLANTPLAARGIRLQESPEGGAIVWVGSQKFAGVGEVTDPEVKAILQVAISAWEKKYTPGL